MTVSIAKTENEVRLDEHLNDVARICRKLLTPARVKAFERCGVSADKAVEIMHNAAWLHDLGKATQEWQEKVRQGKPPTHSLVSLISYFCITEKQFSEISNPCDTALLMSVLAHHGQLSRESFCEDRYRNIKLHPCRCDWAEIADHFENTDISTGFTGKIDEVCLSKAVKIVKHFKKDIVCELAMDSLLHGVYAMVLSMLVSADHLASGGNDAYIPRISSPCIPGDQSKFQKTIQDLSESYICAIAGCGSGKTAAALMHANELYEKGEIDRIVLCLPTRFTSNNLYKDLTNEKNYRYAESDVGIVHSSALQLLNSLKPEDDESDWAIDTLLASSIFERAITITTVDHLIMSLYHGFKYSDRAFGNLMTSFVVFDEIHAYESTTLNAILEAMSILKRYGIPHMMMSATMPNSIRKFFGFGTDTTVIERDNHKTPYTVKRHDKPLTMKVKEGIQATPEARKLISEAQGIKLAIYVNQIERAKALAKTVSEILPDSELFVYHSELAVADRLDIENKAVEAFRKDEPAILIATQAAELSLDISADRMISEWAPADILIQRAGRLNRRGVSHIAENNRLPREFEYQLIVTGLDSEDHYSQLPYKDEHEMQLTIEKCNWDSPYTFDMAIDWCEESLISEIEQKSIGVWSAHTEDTIFGNLPQQNFSDAEGSGIAIRDKSDVQFQVLPEVYLEKLTHDPASVTQYVVPIKRSKYFSLQSNCCIDIRHRDFTVKNRNGRTHMIRLPLNVVKSRVPYNPKTGGFDYTVLNKDIDDFEAPCMNTSDEQFV